MARVGQPGLLLHRQGVEFGAHHDGGSVAVFIDRHQPGLADLFGHLEAERAHLVGEPRRGLHLLERDLRMRMDVLVERIELRIVGLDGRLDRGPELHRIELGACRRGCNHCGSAERGGGEQGRDPCHGGELLRVIAAMIGIAWAGVNRDFRGRMVAKGWLRCGLIGVRCKAPLHPQQSCPALGPGIHDFFTAMPPRRGYPGDSAPPSR